MLRRTVSAWMLAWMLAAGVGLWGCTCGDAAVDGDPLEAIDTQTTGAITAAAESGAAPNADKPQPDPNPSTPDAGPAKAQHGSPDPAAQDPHETPEKKDAPPQPPTFDKVDATHIRGALEADGWKLIGEPKNTETAGIKYMLFSIIKPPRGGAVMLYDYQDQTVARNFEAHMRKQAKVGGAVRREGGRVLAVTIPRHQKEAERLLTRIAGGADVDPPKDKDAPKSDDKAQP
ncbi:MAG: hypothetical protein AAFX99_12375 [Myxococcota bacterium]